MVLKQMDLCHDVRVLHAHCNAVNIWVVVLHHSFIRRYYRWWKLAHRVSLYCFLQMYVNLQLSHNKIFNFKKAQWKKVVEVVLYLYQAKVSRNFHSSLFGIRPSTPCDKPLWACCRLRDRMKQGNRSQLKQS